MQIIKLLFLLLGIYLPILGIIELMRIIFKDKEYKLDNLLFTIGVIFIGIILVTLILFNNF